MPTILANCLGVLYLESFAMAEEQESSLESRSKIKSITEIDGDDEKKESGATFSQIMEEKISSM